MENFETSETDSYKNETLKSSFMAEFHDGYSFKNLVDFMRRINPIAIFEFSHDRIDIFHHDIDAKHILAHVTIKGHELSQYHLKCCNTCDGNCKDGLLSIGMNLKDLQKFIKPVGKKDSLSMYKRSEDHVIYVQPTGPGSKSAQSNFSVFSPCVVEKIRITMPPYATPEHKPNCIIPATTLSQTCNGMNILKSGNIRIRVIGSDLTIDNLTDDRSLGRVDTFSMKPQQNSAEYEIFVKVSTIKALVKLSNLNPNGLIKVYTEPEVPLKMICRINGYGKLRIYICSAQNS
ncbi:hypothetical protein pv_4 [Pithovirus sibericum]|uniref:Proliferating cell nuclear antigen n=1 Tax=Pithovirus sibericum TaxID=1450746 RepID=W5S4C4_9VIRU|nr:hypothetical protein pv_4 [Pithovirus sibericum]AHH01571.1 hypothetical protein pv_4 [Pithovirus sibericum]WIL05128.1 hypothetical protein pmam_89 [Pithovirus mammoth]